MTPEYVSERRACHVDRDSFPLSDSQFYQTAGNARQGSTVPPKFFGVCGFCASSMDRAAPKNFGTPVTRLRRRCAALTRCRRLPPGEVFDEEDDQPGDEDAVGRR